MDRTRTAVAITLPKLAAVAPGVTAMHVFALSLVPSAAGDSATLLTVRSTGKRTNGGLQIVEGALQNSGSVDHGPGNPLTVSLAGSGISTVQSAKVTRLSAGEEVMV